MTYNPHYTPIQKAIEILLFDDVQILDITGPQQIFASANELAVQAGRPPPYQIRVVARRSPVISSSGLGLIADSLPDTDDPVDTFVVAGGQGVHRAASDQTLVDWISHRAGKSRRTVSICTGAFLLAAAGLLDGRRAVTHWNACDALARQFPAIRVEPDPIYIEDQGVWTSAGVTAGMDLTLALVAQDLGHATALEIARDLVVFLKRHGGQAQFSSHLALQSKHQDYKDLHGWIAENLDRTLSIPVLAGKMGMSERSFIRDYKRKTGETPARAVDLLRVESARQLLVSTPLPVKTIAHRCGFGTEETMRRSFLRHIHRSPNSYRTQFAAGS